MALSWQTRIPEEQELEREYDIPRPMLGPIADPVNQSSVTPPVTNASAASSLLDLITATENDTILRGASEWGAFSTGVTGRAVLAAADAATGRTALGAEPTIAAGTTAQYWRGDKSWQTLDNAAVGLGNVTNDAQVKRAEMGVADGVATLDSGGKVPLSQISDTILGQVEYQGIYNATTNTPTLADPPASTTKGDYYVVSVAGTQFGLTFAVGDWIISNGTAWEKVDNTDQVTSVAGRIGAVTLGHADITDLASWTGSSGITTLGTITTGVWSGTAITVAKGGTNLTSYTTGDILYASGTTTLAKLAAVATGQVLVSAGTGTAPAWSGSPTLTSLQAQNIGNVTPGVGSFTTLAASGNITATNGVVVAGAGVGLQLRAPDNTSVTIGVDGGSQFTVAAYSPANFTQGLIVTGTMHSTGANRMSNYGAGAATFDASGNITSVSDLRKKTNVRPFTTGLDAILKLTPILHGYTLESGLDQTRDDYAGFSAQNVRDYIPQAIGKDPHGFLSLADRPIMAALVNAVQTLDRRLSSVEA